MVLPALCLSRDFIGSPKGGGPPGGRAAGAPVEAEVDDRAGAAEAAQYFLRVLQYAQTTTDVSVLNAIRSDRVDRTSGRGWPVGRGVLSQPQASHTPDAGSATKQVGQILGGRSSRLIGRRDCVVRLALATRSRIAAALAAALARAASSASVMTSAGTSSA